MLTLTFCYDIKKQTATNVGRHNQNLYNLAIVMICDVVKDIKLQDII